MALDESVFADYAAAQGDFGEVPISGIAGFPQGLQQAPVAVPQAIPQIQIRPELDALNRAPTQGQGEAANPLAEVKNHPVFQFYDRWKKSSPEMRKNAEMKIGLDFPGGPRDMGLPDPTADVAGEAADAKEGKGRQQDKGAWGKFMKYIDSNPQFLLDLGARLLAPRGGGQSDLGFAAKGLSEAVGAASGRRAAEAKAGLAGRKAEADIAGVEADISKTPSEIALNKARAEAARRGKPAGDKTQRAKQYAAALRMEFPDLFPTDASALLAAESQLTGKVASYDKFVSKFTSDNLVFFDSDPVATGKAAKMAAATLGLTPKLSLENMDEQQRLAEIKKNPNILYDYLAKTYPNATHEQIQTKVEQTAGRKSTRAGKKTTPAAAPVAKKKVTKKTPKAVTPAKKPAVKKDKRNLEAQERRMYLRTIASRSKEELQEYLTTNKDKLSSTQRARLRKAIKSK